MGEDLQQTDFIDRIAQIKGFERLLPENAPRLFSQASVIRRTNDYCHETGRGRDTGGSGLIL